jgi:hypothetical protein
MASYSARPETAERAQCAWDALASRYPKMRAVQLVSEVKGVLGWQWSMQFKSIDGDAVFWDSVPVKEIQEMVADSSKAKERSDSRKMKLVARGR